MCRCLRSDCSSPGFPLGFFTSGFQMQIESLCTSEVFFLQSHSLLMESECSEILCMTNLPPAPLFLTAGSHWISGTVHTLPHWRAAGGWEHMHLLEKCVHSVCLWKTRSGVFQQETFFCLSVQNGSCFSPPLATTTAACLLNSLYRLIGYFRDCLKSLRCRKKHTAGMFWHCHKDIWDREWQCLVNYITLF